MQLLVNAGGLFIMYPYHNRIKQRINNNELIGYSYQDSYNHIKEPVLLLEFNTEPRYRPIRKHRIDEYEKLLKNDKNR